MTTENVLSVTVDKRIAGIDSQHSERHELAILVHQVAQSLGDGTSTEGTLKDRSGVVVGEWNYSARP